MTHNFNLQAPPPEEVSRVLTREITERVVQLLSLQPDESVAHNVHPHGDGLRIDFHYPPYKSLYAFALPWARGWSVFLSYDPDAGPYSWSAVPSHLRRHSYSIKNKRNVVGPHRTNPRTILYELTKLTHYLDHLRTTRDRRQPKERS